MRGREEVRSPDPAGASPSVKATTTRLFVPCLALDLAIPAEEVHTYDAYTLPSFRGLGISPAISVHVMQTFKRAGFRRASRTILPENRPRSTLARRRATGSRVMGYVKLGPWRRNFGRAKSTDLGSGGRTTRK